MPTFTDFLRELPQVIDESSYSADAKGDYTGALVTRVSSLTNGIMGSIFCSDGELEDAVLFDQNTIVDLSRVGSSETKALMMGILVMKLNEYRMSGGSGMNSRLRHITVIEEAHNLLRRVTGGGSELATKDPALSGQQAESTVDEGASAAGNLLDDAEAIDALEIAYDKSHYNSAVAIANDLIKRGVGGARVYQLLACCYIETGRDNQAITTMQDMIRALPEDIEARYWAAFFDLRLLEGRARESRKHIDWLLQSEEGASARVAALDVEYYIDTNDFALADTKMEEYRTTVGRDIEFTKSVGFAYRQLAESYWSDYGGAVFFDSKENFQNWKKYYELSLSVYPDAEAKARFTANLKDVNGVTFEKENFAGILFAFFLAFLMYDPRSIGYCIVAILDDPDDSDDDDDDDDDPDDSDDDDDDEPDDSDDDDDKPDDSDDDNDDPDESNDNPDKSSDPDKKDDKPKESNKDDLGNSPDDGNKKENSGDPEKGKEMLHNDDLGSDPRDSLVSTLWDELNKELDEKQERTEDREKFQEGYNQDAVNKMKDSDPEQYDRMMAANRMATREEIDAAAGGETCWDSMSKEDKFAMLDTNPDRAKALLQDYQDRHPGGLDEGDEGFNIEKKYENQAASKELRDNNDGIPQDMLESSNPFHEFVSGEQTEGSRL